MEIGSKFTTELNVTAELTAEKIGSGDMPVLATPSMIAMMENAAMKCVSDDLEDGQTTVGIMMNASHVKASPVGSKVYATAELVAIDGRKLSFKIVAYQGTDVIGEATHDRFIVVREKFLAKVQQ
ncbi:MAG: thioesterase family protein [Bacteroidales bacterium]|nr:thioesterase family protein [Bacteroidales bacterium]